MNDPQNETKVKSKTFTVVVEYGKHSIQLINQLLIIMG